MGWRLLSGDCIDVMASMPEAGIDAIVCDPPYGLEFMGKDWDKFGRDTSNGYREKPRITDRDVRAGTLSAYTGAQGKGVNHFQAGRPFQAWCESWAREALRVLRPGGHLLAFGGTRTYHRLACGIDDAGFEVRDTIAWMYGSGFPKSRNIGDGCGTALKPGHEPIVLARKPLTGTVAATVEKHGTGALNIDACRIENTPEDREASNRAMSGDRMWRKAGQEGAATFNTGIQPDGATMHALGRWPANVVLDQEAAAMLDQQSGQLVSGANPTRRGSDKFRDVYGDFKGQEECEPARGVDAGGASRFFYCAKPDATERHGGLGEPVLWSTGDEPDRNDHPTVKPIDLMRWLVRLVTPDGGTVLDPFMGSGTTGCAAVLEGRDVIGIEREAQYLAIARARITHWAGGVPEEAAA